MPDESIEARMVRTETQLDSHQKQCDEERAKIGSELRDIKDSVRQQNVDRSRAVDRIHRRIDEVGDQMKDIVKCVELSAQRSDAAISKSRMANKIWALTAVVVMLAGVCAYLAQDWMNDMRARVAAAEQQKRD